MKTAYLAIFLAVLATSAFGQNAFAGTSGFDIKSGPQNTDCFYRVFAFPSADHLTLEQQYRPINVQPPQPIPDTCHVPNFVFTSFFKDDQLSADDQLVVIPPTNATNPVYDVSFTADWLNKNNGTACVILPQTSKPGLDQYLCSVNYAGTPLYFVTFGTGNFTFDTDEANHQGLVVSRVNTQDFYIHAYIIGFNVTFPNITADLFASCGSTSNVINALSAPVTVTTATDLTAYLPGVWLGYTLVKKLNATDSGDYLVIPSTSQAALFTPGSGSGCWSMAISYSDILPDMDYCSGGCKVSFILRDDNGQLYVLETSGIQTTDNSAGNGGDNSGSGSGSGSNGTNSTGSGPGSGSGSGSGSGNNNGGGDGGAVASSASSMVFNACLLLISFAYLAWL